MLGLGGATALALTGVLAGTAAIAGLAAALALALVMAFTDVVVAAGFFTGDRDIRELRAGDQTARHTHHHLAKITTIHSHFMPLMCESIR